MFHYADAIGMNEDCLLLARTEIKKAREDAKVVQASKKEVAELRAALEVEMKRSFDLTKELEKVDQKMSGVEIELELN